MINSEGDKRQITAGLAANYLGEKLNVQLIFKGLTAACLPKEKKKNILYCQTDTHWQDVASTIKLLETIIFPFFKDKKKELQLPDEQFSLILWDIW